MTPTISDDSGQQRDLVWWEHAMEFEVVPSDESNGKVQMEHRWQRREVVTDAEKGVP